MIYTIDKSRTIGSTQVYRHVIVNDDSSIFATFGPSFDYINFENKGKVYVTDNADFGGVGSIITVQKPINNDSIIKNSGTLSIDLDGTGFGGNLANARGIRCDSWSPKIINEGLIFVSAAGGAWGIEGWGYKDTFGVTNSGTIAVTSPRSATALYLPNGAVIVNSGTISASGADAWAICMAAIGAGTITNLPGGVISATRTSGTSPSLGITFFANGTVPVITNFGTISADHAIEERNDNGNGRANSAQQVVYNYGLIKGAIMLGLGQDHLTSSGRIIGDVSMGSGEDWVDLTGGSVSGVVDGGSGNDNMVGGDKADRFIGGQGYDRLTGGSGADVLTGGRDVDVLSGGLGRDLFVYHSIAESAYTGRDIILDFVVGQDRIDLSAIDAVRGGANNTFVWSEAPPSKGHGAGMVWFDSASHTLFASNDVDAMPELAIQMDGVTAITAADIIL